MHGVDFLQAGELPCRAAGRQGGRAAVTQEWVGGAQGIDVKLIGSSDT